MSVRRFQLKVCIKVVFFFRANRRQDQFSE